MEEFDLHELAVEDAIKGHQRPKLEVYGDWFFLILKTARYVDPDRELIDFTGEVVLFVGERFLISVRHGDAAPLDGVRHRLEERPDLLAHGAAAVLHGVVDAVVDGYQDAVERLDPLVEHVQEITFSEGGDAPVEQIYRLKREMLDFHRATFPLIEPFHRLSTGRWQFVAEELSSYFRDVEDHLIRVVGQVDAYSDLLTSVLQANLTQVSLRQNEDMRKISAWVAIIAVPTMIAGVYGMNFEHMPELEWEFGYPLVVGAMLVVCTALFMYFRRIGWLGGGRRSK